MMIDIRIARVSLTKTWLIGSGLLLLLMLQQTLTLPHADNVRDLWAWIIPLLAPTLGLIVGVWAYEHHNNKSSSKVADAFLFKMTKLLSVCYMLLIASTPLLRPLVPYSMAEWLTLSQYWLGFLQAPVTAVIGALFAQSRA